MHTCTDKGRDVKIYLIGVKIRAKTYNLQHIYAETVNVRAKR